MGPRRCVLYVEDQENDVSLMRFAFDRAALSFDLATVADGDEAMSYLSGHGHFADRLQFPLPALIITDLKMPKVDGFEFLNWLRTQPRIKHIPTVVFSSSCHEKDLERAIHLGARAYYIKPSPFPHFVELIRTVTDRWLNQSHHPAL